MNEESVTIEWQGTGPGANVNPPLPFQCRLDGDTIFQPCMFSRVYNPRSLKLLLSPHYLSPIKYMHLTGTSPHSMPISGLSNGEYVISIRYYDPNRLVCTNRSLARFNFQIAS